MKLRLLITDLCFRDCEGCCNKDWDLENLPEVTHFDYDEILITGGEPMLFADEVILLAKMMRIASKAKLYLYTSMPTVNGLSCILHKVMKYIDGVTVTLHDQNDAEDFKTILFDIATFPDIADIYRNKSLRLNVFKGVVITAPNGWKVKDNIEWVANCPLPKDEEFKRL